MALEAVVFPQGPFGYGSKDFTNLLAANWSYEFNISQEVPDSDFPENHPQDILHGERNNSSLPTPPVEPQLHDLHQTSSSDANNVNNSFTTQPESSANPNRTRPRRRRSRRRKNKEEIENQRMTHIAVERNRRKLMNEYLAVLRSLMPESYVQRGDQASIVGGAINFVKELEQCLHILNSKREMRGNTEGNLSPLPFSEFFTFPQYSYNPRTLHDHYEARDEGIAKTRSGIADVEVTVVESHANIKIRSKRRPKQFLRMVSGLHSMHLTILHLNFTAMDRFVLYSLSVKVEDDCKLASVDEIAAAVYEMLGRIQEEAF